MDIQETTLVEFFCPLSTCEHPHKCIAPIGYLPEFPTCPFCIGRINCLCNQILPYNPLWNAKRQGINIPRFSNKIKLVKDMELRFSEIERFGIIPFTIKDSGENSDGFINPHKTTYGEFFYCLGTDRQTGDLCNFGGSSKTRDFSPVVSAIREFREESKNVFKDYYDPKIYLNSYCIITGQSPVMKSRRLKSDEDKGETGELKSSPQDGIFDFIGSHRRNVFIFLYVNPDLIEKSQIDFKNKLHTKVFQERHCDEMSNIHWLSEREFKNEFFCSRFNGKLWTAIKRQFISSSISYHELREMIARTVRS